MKTYDNHLSRYHFMYDRTIVPEMFLSACGNEQENDPHEKESSSNWHEEETPSTALEARYSTVPDGTTESFVDELKRGAMCWILKIKENCKLTQSTMDDIIRVVTDFNNYILSKLCGVIQKTLTDVGMNMENNPQLA